ncbi:RHS repeat-associated core domain-containing protein [Myxococcus sp. SDU36]|uniref:RHS repeat-associated core domain-containing protein n=1 Tax=Myxococcus sp. SDU36 TaxID=2831967 RepID=UPI00254364B9|nr:RHS repeat-associated core domain-containing protein [Myxococcus sp. SDU36]WIG95619.1 RHS repeat-associated core domain-containing protein [Myxococcus sp. SDU36]
MSSSNPASQSQPPAIRTFQMDDRSVGNLSSSVNLFRGDVNLTQSLFTLPGRSEGNGLDVSLSLQYQSNVFREATTWNREAPTGVVGLGWSLPLTWIEAMSSGSPVPDTRQYALFENGVPNTLIRQPWAPRLFSADAALAGGLADGKPVPAALIEEFHAHGLLLSADAIARGGHGTWELVDDTHELLYALEVGERLQAKDGGEAYQLQNYQFWKIQYYPRYERWVVTSDSAVRRSFGGGVTRGSAGARSVNDTVAWSVWWKGSNGEPRWSGASMRTEGQVQVAQAWYLGRVTDRFGSTVTYAYNGFERTDDGLRPGCEQRVGTGGLPYTKAVYLTRITDVFGRTVTLGYGDKLWSAEETAPREYADPHRAVPSDAPGAWQDRYETRFLDTICVQATDGSPLFTFGFSYDPRPDADGREREVANVTASTASLRGDTFKRFLTRITQLDQDGVASPGLVFDYHLDAATEGGQPGALASLTSPEGGTATYTYTRQNLSLCERRAEVKRPDAVGGGSPRVYYGPDYTVVTYYNQSKGRLSLQVWTWGGAWLTWQLDPDDALLDTLGLDLDSLQVVANQDFFALTFTRITPSERAVYVFDRDVARPGQWRSATINGVTTAKNAPTLTLPTSGATTTFVGGTTWLAVAQMSSRTLSGSYEVLTWRWTTRAWTRETIVSPRYTWIAGAGEYLATLDFDGKLALRWLDSLLVWRSGPPTTFPKLSTVDLDSVALVPGASLVAVSNLIAGNSQQNVYRVWVAQWTADYALEVHALGEFSDTFGRDNPPTPWIPQVIDDTLVATNGNLARFDGTAWAVSTKLNPGMPDASHDQRYAFGPDYAIQVIVPSTGAGAAVGQVMAYDPTAGWRPAPARLGQSLPPQDTQRANWPTSGGADWAVVGPYVYFRGTASDWGAIATAPASANLESLVSAEGYHFDSESLVDQGPTFLSFTTGKGSSSQRVEAVVLRNGQVGKPVPFLEEKMASGTGPGTSPKGPQLFATYPQNAVSFDAATTVYLHQYAGDAFAGPIEHYAVTGLDVTDGYQDEIPTRYVFDTATAGCDPLGNIVKYFSARTCPGTSDAANPVNGWVDSTYLNGMADETGKNHYDMLDGLLLRTQTRDCGGVLLESTEATWVVYQQVASDVLEPETLVLRGGWVAQTVDTQVINGVSTTKTTMYVPNGAPGSATGQPVTLSLQQCGGEGQAQTFVQTTLQGVAVDAGLAAIHALTDPAQVTNTVTTDTGTVPLQVMATTYAGWPNAEGVIVAVAEATFGLLDAADAAFPFASYTPGDNPAGWALAARTTEHTPYGQEQESVDGIGVPTATLYSANCEFAVARSSNAPFGGLAFLGFQPYEDTARWTLSGVEYDADEVRTGIRAARLPGGANAALAVTVTPEAPEGTYLVGAWVRTPAGFAANGTTGICATVTVDGVAATPLFVPLPATDGAWRYVTVPVPLGGPQVLGGAVPAPDRRSAARRARLAARPRRTRTLATGSAPLAPRSAVTEASVVLAVSLTNTTASPVTIDSVLVGPLANSLVSRTFDEPSQQITSTQDASGRTTRTYYDRAFQPTVSVGASGEVKELTQSFLSRRGNDGVFSPTSPNAEVTLHPATGGVLETFRDGDCWRERWDASAGWAAANGALVHTGATAGAVTWRGTAKGTRAVYFELQARDVVASVSVGDVTIRWDGEWSASQGGGAWTALATPPLEQHWLLVVGDGVVLFFAGGQLLYSQSVRPAGDTVSITLAGEGAIRNLSVAEDVRVGVCYNDAAGRQRQVQQLQGADSIVACLVHDALDRQLVTTKGAPGSFGSGQNQPVLQYRPGFVDVDDFLANLSTTWELKGDVADYYRGQTEDGIMRSDDKGYPYQGMRYEASPRQQALEQGSPGKPYAIDLSVPEEQRQTTRLRFGANAAESLPAGQYFQDTLTSPVQTRSVRLTDHLSQTVRSTYVSSTGEEVSRTSGNRTYSAGASGPVATLQTALPNALVSGPQQLPSAYAQRTTTDALQRTESLADPDAGQTQFVSDVAGRLRFVQPAMDAGEQWFVYYKYDALGRMVEEGTLWAAWDATALRLLANQPDWPTEATTVAVTMRYDGDGHEPTLIGMKWSSVANNPGDDADVTVTEVFGYDEDGHLSSVRMKLDGPTAADGTIAYTYDNLSQVVRVDFPEGAPLAAVHYAYDELGHLVSVGTAAGLGDLATYGWSADGTVQREVLGQGAWTRLVDSTSRGQVAAMTTTSAAGDQAFALAYAYDADGVVHTRRVRWRFAGKDLSQEEVFGYDGQRRLLTAAGATPTTIRAYDPSGNIWEAEESGTRVATPCVDGSDRVASLTVGSEPAQPLTWSARGQLLAGAGRTFGYDRATSMTTRIEASGGALRLAYGGSQQRVLKRRRDGADSVYFFGAGLVPVARRDGESWTVLLQGASGLLALVGEATRFVLTDPDQSVWAVVEDATLVARYAYAPFGGLTLTEGDTAVTPYLFQGQEWDSEVGLYNFRARMYDPVLRRFVTPDPQRQFASPYIFAANNPLGITDPTGEFSLGEQIGVAVAMVAITLIGFGLSLFTGGSSSAAVGAAKRVAKGTAKGAKGAAKGATGAAEGATGAAEGAAAGAAEGAAAAGSEAVAAGASVVEGAASSTTSVSKKITQFGRTVASNTLSSAGRAGLNYDVKHGRDFSAKGCFEAMGIGAAAGFTKGVVSGFGTLATGKLANKTGRTGIAARLGAKAVVGAAGSAVSNDLATILTNVQQHEPWYQGLAKSTVNGFASGTSSGSASGAWSEIVNIPKVAKVTDQMKSRVNNLIDKVKSVAASKGSYTLNGTAAFFAMPGYDVWGTAGTWGRSD